jgi:ASC-1-like (ASCH) protein
MENQPTEWNMPLFYWAYEAIVNKTKTIEGRVPNPEKPEKDYSKMKVGDVLKFYVVKPGKLTRDTEFPDIRHRVTFTHHYDTIEEMLKAEGFEKMTPHVNSIDESVQVYLGFPGIPERVPKYGIYALGLGERVV